MVAESLVASEHGWPSGSARPVGVPLRALRQVLEAPVTPRPKPLPPLDWRRIWEELDTWECSTPRWTWLDMKRRLRRIVERERKKVKR